MSWSKSQELSPETDGTSIRAAVAWPAIVCGSMLLIAGVTASAAKIDVRPLLSYYECATVTVLCVLCFIFIDVARLAIARADDPVSVIKERMRVRLPLLILPAVVLPAFLLGYTAAKCAIPFLVGYTWDGFWADIDRFIFRDDVWRIARRLLGDSYKAEWEWYYSIGWGSAFLIVANAVAFYGSKRFVGVYFTALLATWLIGGCLVAYAFSAAGPVFAPLFDGSLEERFRPLRDLMNASVAGSPIETSQHYLQIAATHRVAAKGGGISAMPSMHLGAASIYVLAARRTKWLFPALLFWLTIFVASGYFGFHYWVDGIAAALVAGACWCGAEALYSRSNRSEIKSVKARLSAVG